MSMSPPEMTPNGMQPSPKPGMSTGAKVLIVLAIVFGILLVLCCGGVIATFFYLQSYAAESFSEDPAKVAAVTQEIAQLDIPEGLEPAGSVNMKVPFTGQSLMTVAVYADEETGSVLILTVAGEAFGSQNQAQMQQSIDQSLRQQGMGDKEEILIQESHKKEIEIRGQPVTFTIANGKGAESETPRIQVTGTFEGRAGPAMLIMNADAEKFPEEKIVEMIESIK